MRREEVGVRGAQVPSKDSLKLRAARLGTLTSRATRPPPPRPSVPLLQGGTSKDFENIKRMAFTQPDTLHLLLDKLADNIADYCRYQVRRGEGRGPRLEAGSTLSGVVWWLDAEVVHPRCSLPPRL